MNAIKSKTNKWEWNLKWSKQDMNMNDKTKSQLECESSDRLLTPWIATSCLCCCRPVWVCCEERAKDVSSLLWGENWVKLPGGNPTKGNRNGALLQDPWGNGAPAGDNSSSSPATWFVIPPSIKFPHRNQGTVHSCQLFCGEGRRMGFKVLPARNHNVGGKIPPPHTPQHRKFGATGSEGSQFCHLPAIFLTVVFLSTVAFNSKQPAIYYIFLLGILADFQDSNEQQWLEQW